MIKDWNKGENKKGEVFHFKNSLRPFIEIVLPQNNYTGVFVDINTFEGYQFDDLEYEGLEFYSKEDDKDFMGVQVDGRIEWVD